MRPHFCNLAPSASPGDCIGLDPIDPFRVGPEPAINILSHSPCGSSLAKSALSIALMLAAGLAACGGNDDDNDRVVRVTSSSPNVVSYWNDVANRTVNATATVNVTPEEQRPSYHVDLAAVHIAIYDAISATTAAMCRSPTPLRPRAASLALRKRPAYVCGALFQSPVQYSAYDSAIGAIADGTAKARGITLGAEVAAAVVAMRADDGRAVVLAPYVSSSAPGRFRSASPTPFNRYVPYIKPLSLTRVDQFRPAPPPDLTSAEYAASFNESKAAAGPRVRGEPGAAETARFTRGAGGFRDPQPVVRRHTTALRGGQLIGFVSGTGERSPPVSGEVTSMKRGGHRAIPLADGDGTLPRSCDPRARCPTPNPLISALIMHLGRWRDAASRLRPTHVVFDFDSNALTRRALRSDRALNQESENRAHLCGCTSPFDDRRRHLVSSRGLVADHHFGRRK